MSEKKLTTIEVCYKIQGFAELKGNYAIDSGEWDNIVSIVSDCEFDGGSIGYKMSANHFISWLQGFIEISNDSTVDQNQWNLIKEHLQLVFEKVTSELDPNDPPQEDSTSESTNINDIIEAIERAKEREDVIWPGVPKCSPSLDLDARQRGALWTDIKFC